MLFLPYCSYHKNWLSSRKILQTINVVINNCQINYPDEPTYYHIQNENRPSILDLVVTKNCTVTKPNSLFELNSNHNPVSFKLLVNVDVSKTFRINDYKNTNWGLFREKIDELITINPLIDNINDLELKVANFTKVIIQASQETIPKITINMNQKMKYTQMTQFYL